ncbi:hypothetical protein FRC08_009753 [Ceratobasidium sp. 394]|nr:hypothetical protein FRC08_009753 [Ceratobasidium sp. 394]KAG9091319.1 hypothetical protein FS749_016633 [Ceratobasidium sp. UAMH 11750]
MTSAKNNIWALVNNPKANTSASSSTSLTATQTATQEAASLGATGTIYPGRIPAGGEMIHYPLSEAERVLFRTSTGKKLTHHQWAVYDHTLSIPVGHVSTYKAVCEALGHGSPRSVGSALRNNPFAPYVPCHRVIASNLYLGGFCGEWGPESKTGTQFERKLKLLLDEGVEFDSSGMLKTQDALWRPE